MGTVVGLLLVVIAGATIIGVLWFVMREQHSHEEHYIPQPRSTTPPTSGVPSAVEPSTSATIIGETSGAPIVTPSPTEETSDPER